MESGGNAGREARPLTAPVVGNSNLGPALHAHITRAIKYGIGSIVEYRGWPLVVIGIGQALDGTIVYLTQPPSKLIGGMYSAYPENALKPATEKVQGVLCDVEA